MRTLFVVITICLAVLTGCKKKEKDSDTNTNSGNSTAFDFSWSPNEPVETYPITFSSTAPVGSTYLWTFGDGNVSADSAPQHTYGTKGLYTVTLTINNDTKNIITKQVTVGKIYWMAITGSRVLGDTLHFSTGVPAGISSKWMFGDGDSSIAAAPEHVYTKTGSYQVKVILNNTYYAPGNGMIEIVNDPLYTNKIPGNKIWHYHVHLSSPNVIDSSFTTDEILNIIYEDKITLLILSTNCVSAGPVRYDPKLSAGNVLVYKNDATSLYYDHVMDTSYIESKFYRSAGPGQPRILTESYGRP